jgi:hypothetical protein
MVRSTNVDRSCFGHLVEDLRYLFSSERIVSITKILTEQNYANLELARFGMLEDRTEIPCWVVSIGIVTTLLFTAKKECNGKCISLFRL